MQVIGEGIGTVSSAVTGSLPAAFLLLNIILLLCVSFIGLLMPVGAVNAECQSNNTLTETGISACVRWWRGAGGPWGQGPRAQAWQGRSWLSRDWADCTKGHKDTWGNLVQPSILPCVSLLLAHRPAPHVKY